MQKSSVPQRRTLVVRVDAALEAVRGDGDEAQAKPACRLDREASRIRFRLGESGCLERTLRPERFERHGAGAIDSAKLLLATIADMHACGLMAAQQGT